MFSIQLPAHLQGGMTVIAFGVRTGRGQAHFPWNQAKCSAWLPEEDFGHLQKDVGSDRAIDQKRN